ncbi:MAG: hypothetical protein OXN84_14425 [Albidovulum sp.]|nr:hypothetical protein [Albidovulum sp.]
MAPAFPDLPLEEYEARWNKTRMQMAESGLDALWITGRPNYEYSSILCLSGTRMTIPF